MPKFAEARPSMPKHAKARPSTPKQAQACPSTPKYVQSLLSNAKLHKTWFSKKSGKKKKKKERKKMKTVSKVAPMRQVLEASKNKEVDCYNLQHFLDNFQEFLEKISILREMVMYIY